MRASVFSSVARIYLSVNNLIITYVVLKSFLLSA